MNEERLKIIYEENGLEPDDIFTLERSNKDGSKKKIPIITRTGIEKIMATHNIEVLYEMISYDLDNVVIKAMAEKGGKEDVLSRAQSYGEASPRNLSKGSQNYPIAMAEKRAKARAVLQLTGLYKEGIFSEDEDETLVDAKEKQGNKSQKAIKSAT